MIMKVAVILPYFARLYRLLCKVRSRHISHLIKTGQTPQTKYLCPPRIRNPSSQRFAQYFDSHYFFGIHKPIAASLFTILQLAGTVPPPPLHTSETYTVETILCKLLFSMVATLPICRKIVCWTRARSAAADWRRKYVKHKFTNSRR